MEEKTTIPWPSLAAVVGAAALARLVVGGMTQVIGADGPAFLRIAARIADGDLPGALAHDYHPLYPALIAIVSRVGIDLEAAATAVSFVSGVLLPVPLFFLARTYLGPRVGLVAGLLAAFHPTAAHLSVDQKSDALYALLLVTAVAIVWEGIRTRRPLLLVLGGMSSGLAYLARPEGLGVALVAAAWLAVSSRKPLLIGCLILGAAVPAVPYVAAISDEGFRITRKKGISDFVGYVSHETRATGLCLVSMGTIQGEGSPTRRLRDHADEMGTVQRAGWAGAEIVVEVVKTTHPVLLLFLLIGVVRVRALPRRRDQEAFVLSNLLLYLSILFLLVLGVHYLSRRHVFPLAVLVLPWVAAGGVEAVAWVKGKDRLALVLLGGVLLVLSTKTFYPNRLDQIPQREAGLWIRAVSGGKAAPVLTPHEKVAYYAGAMWVPFSPEYRATLDIGRHHGARYAVFIREKVDRVCPGFVEAIREEEMVRRFTIPVVRESLLGETRHMNLDVYEIKVGSGKH